MSTLWQAAVRAALAIAVLSQATGVASRTIARAAGDEPATADALPRATHQITGLFSKDRVDDLHRTMADVEGVKLVDVDFDRAEAKFEYDAAKAFPGASPEQIVERLDNLLRNASRHTFGVKPLCTTPRDKMQLVEIRVAGLDCKACALGAYEAIYRLEGVEQATASFRDGLVTAWIHAEKTDRAMLEEALRKREVQLVPKQPAP